MKFKKKSESRQDIPTAALPDIIFMLLFFFMVSTVLRETEVMVKQDIPRAEQLVKLERKDLVAKLFIGEPKYEVFGEVAKIQARDVFIDVDQIPQWIEEERSRLAESDRDRMTVSMKVDKETNMGIIVDVQTELRNAKSRKVMYAAPTKLTEGN